MSVVGRSGVLDGSENLRSQHSGAEGAVCEGDVLIQQLKAVSQRQKEHYGKGWHEHGQRDDSEALECGCAVNLRRLIKIIGDIIQARDIDNHHVSGHLPGNQDRQGEQGLGVVLSHILQKWNWQEGFRTEQNLGKYDLENELPNKA